MPSCITHQIIAEEAKAALPDAVADAAEKHADYYFLGAQGPDVFFFYRPFSKKEFNLGRFMHRRCVYEVFSFFARYLPSLADEEREQANAYVAGYLCHYAADTAFHPYVYRYLAAHESVRSEHQLIESDWDVFFAREKRNKNAEGWKFPLSAKKINREGTLFRLYFALCTELGRIPPTKRNFNRGISLYGKYLKFFHGKSHYQGWRRAEKLFRFRPIVSSLYPRKDTNPAYLYGEDFLRLSGEENADALFFRAVTNAENLSEDFFAAVRERTPLPREEFNKSFLTAEQAE